MEHALNVAHSKAINLRPEEEIIYDFIVRLSSIFKIVIKGNAEMIEQNLNLMPFADNKNDELKVPGIPGTIHNSIIIALSILLDISVGFQQIFDKPKEKIGETMSTINEQMDPKELVRAIRDIEGNVMTTNNTSEMIKTLSEQNSDIVKKIDQASMKLAKTSKPNEKQIKELLKLYNEVLNRRASFNPQRMKILGSLQSTQDSYISLMEKFTEYLLLRDNALIQLIDEISVAFVTLSSKIYKSAETLEMCSKKIDMKYDIKVFAESKRIYRYDLVCPDFVDIDYDFDNTKVPKEVKNDYPVALAEVVENFICGGENEISCTKGKYLLLMEFPDEEWCCVTNPFTHSIGYVPSYCVKPISNTFGICIREPKPGEATKGIIINVGDFVSILKNDPKEKVFHVATVRGERGTVSKGLIAIIYDE